MSGIHVFARAVCDNCYTGTEEYCVSRLSEVVSKAKRQGWIVRDRQLFCSEKCAQEDAALLKRIRESHSVVQHQVHP